METPSDLIRAGDWEDRLATYLDNKADEPFAWGSHDCALFGAGAVRAMTGVDPAAALRGTYDSHRGALEALRAHAHGTLLKTMRAWFTELPTVHLAKRGDLVMLDRTTVGVCAGQFSWFVGEEQGQDRLKPVPTASCAYAFSLPFGGDADV